MTGIGANVIGEERNGDCEEDDVSGGDGDGLGSRRCAQTSSVQTASRIELMGLG